MKEWAGPINSVKKQWLQTVTTEIGLVNKHMGTGKMCLKSNLTTTAPHKVTTIGHEGVIAL